MINKKVKIHQIQFNSNLIVKDNINKYKNKVKLNVNFMMNN